MPNSRPRPTIIDVATAAGVSRTTASDALNGRGRVGEETRARVVEAAAKLGYRVDVNARSLRRGSSSVLALFLPTMEEAGESQTLGLEYYMRLANAAAIAAFAHRHALLLMPPLDGSEDHGHVSFDGAILSDPEREDRQLDLLDRQRVPTVTIERDPGRPEREWYVTSDTPGNTAKALDHFAERGARRIALLRPHAHWAYAEEGNQVYEEWTGARGVEAIVATVPGEGKEGKNGDAFEVGLELLSRVPRPDAVLAFGERYGNGVVRAAASLGIRTPEQLLVVCLIDGPPNTDLEPPITAIDLHPERQAELAVKMLLARLAGEKTEKTQIVGGDLIVRRSTAGLVADEELQPGGAG